MARPAQVAELVDAQVSGTCGLTAVEVRVFSWAPFLSYKLLKFLTLHCVSSTIWYMAWYMRTSREDFGEGLTAPQ